MSKTHLIKGRAATVSPDNRYAAYQTEYVNDGWEIDQDVNKIDTQLFVDNSKSVITYNQSPDVPFDRSINPYRGCEHGCVYCFARPKHAYLDLSPGLDFESKLFYKPNAAVVLRKELAHKNYRVAPIALGVATDAYQPIERKLNVTRNILEVLINYRHPIYVITKSSAIERDIDLLAEAAAQQFVGVSVSLTTLDHELSRKMEPRAASPKRRLQTIKQLSDAGIPVSAFVAPLIPVLNDSELETMLRAARDHGAVDAVYILLRLPQEVAPIFNDWMQKHEPLKADHITKRIRDMRGGKDNDPNFGTRMRGTGVFADLMAQRFKVAYQKLAFPGAPYELRSDLFMPPNLSGQLSLF